MLDKGGIVGAVFLDLRKAFDTVNHTVLLNKLNVFKFSDAFIHLIMSYLSGRSQFVKINNHKSTTLQLNTGVPQGSILGPILFSLYINDLPSICDQCETLLYADDTVIFTSGKNADEVAVKLTQAMSKITSWLNHCCLQLNVSKTVGMFFSKNHLYPQSDIFISGQRLDVVTKFKYLGLHIDSHFSFADHVKAIRKKIQYSLSNFRYIRNSISTQAAKMFFHSLILSHMTYCLTSWSNTHKSTIKPLESLYKQALKILDKKPLSYHHCNILQKYRLLSWDNLLKFHHICLVYKIVHGLAPPPLSTYVTVQSNRSTRGTTRGDYPF